MKTTSPTSKAYLEMIEQNKRLRQMYLQLSEPTLHIMERLGKEAADISRYTIKPLRDMTVFVKRVQNQVKAISQTYNRVLSEMAKSARPIMKTVEKLMEIANQSEFFIFYENWGWLEWIPVKVFFTLYFDYKAGKFQFLQDFDKWLAEEAGSKALLEKCLQSKVHIRRQRYIENIFALHRDGNHISSIPLALIQIEGIVRDLGVLKGYLRNEENPQYIVNPINKANKKASFGGIVIDLFGQTDKFLGKELQSPLTKHLTQKVYVGDLRHAILHGNKLDYEDPMLSAHLIATLVSLTSKAMKIETTSKIKPYWEK